MKYFLTVLFVFYSTLVTKAQEAKINTLLDEWHQAAANADLDGYFGFMDDDSYYLGTDKTEIWTKAEFLNFCKPYFEKKTTWDFKAVSRNVFFSEDKSFAWFEEVLDTWMGACRGSGVLVSSGDSWKLKQYNLSVLIDNADIKSYLELIKKGKNE